MEEKDIKLKKYNIIYADPPWAYNDKMSGNRGACYKYDVMDIEEIKKIPVQNIAADDCALFMWATMPHLKSAFNLMETWGFTYKTNAFTWVKRSKNGNWFTGCGSWTRSNAELCLLGVKGKIRRKNADVNSVISARVMEHSKKPNIVRDRIVRLMGNLPRIELFSREKIKGWDVWGNESETNFWDEFTIKRKESKLKGFLK